MARRHDQRRRQRRRDPRGPTAGAARGARGAAGDRAAGREDAAARTAVPIGPVGLLAAAWGIAGVGALLLRAMWRLAPASVEVIRGPALGGREWAFALGWIAFMGFFEGYKGFQQAFSPRVVARALHLARHPRALHAALAPLFCMGLVHATRRRLAVSWTLVALIVGLVVGVRRVPQPWRGIVDAGVLLGLAWGVASIAVLAARAALGRPPRVSPDLPADAGAEPRSARRTGAAARE